jgi:hypothetical protein
MVLMKPAHGRRRLIQLGGVVVALTAVVAFLFWRSTADGDPSAGALRDAVAAAWGERCASRISVREIDYIGGPGLPDGMRRAREVVCDADVAAVQPEDETGHPRLAIHYVFSSTSDARAWLRSSGYQLGDSRYGWWLHGDTLIGDSGLQQAAWRRVLSSLK